MRSRLLAYAVPAIGNGQARENHLAGRCVFQILNPCLQENAQGEVGDRTGYQRHGQCPSHRQSPGKQRQPHDFQREQGEVCGAQGIAFSHHQNAHEYATRNERQPELPFRLAPFAALKGGIEKSDNQRTAHKAHTEDQVGLVKDERIVANGAGGVRLVESLDGRGVPE